MTKFIIATVVINLIAMIAVIVAAHRANKKDQEDYINRGPKPW